MFCRSLETSDILPPSCFAFETRASSPRSLARACVELSFVISVPSPTRALKEESISRTSTYSDAAWKV